MRFRPLFAGMGFALLLAAGSAAQTPLPLPPEQEREAVKAMERLRSPYTPSHTVDMCPSAPALRDSIRVMAMNGMSTDAIVEDVISRHGERLRILPKRSGVGLLAWIATPLVLIVGLGLIAYRLRQGQQDESAAVPSGPISEEDRTELAAALRAWDEKGSVDE